MGLLTIDNALWVLGLILQLGLLRVLVARGGARKFPWFTGFVAYETVQNVALFVVYRTAAEKVFFWSYWGFDIVDACFQLGLVYEMARLGLRSRGIWVREARGPFLLYGAIGAAGAALMTFGLNPKWEISLYTWPFRLDQFSSLLILELVCVLLWSANRLELHWGSWLLGLCRGLGLWLFVSLSAGAAQAYRPHLQEFVIFNRLQIGAYIAALVMWTVTFWREEPKREPVPMEVLEEISHWGGGLGYDGLPKIPTDQKRS
jgi:hypothetical protein